MKPKQNGNITDPKWKKERESGERERERERQRELEEAFKNIARKALVWCPCIFLASLSSLFFSLFTKSDFVPYKSLCNSRNFDFSCGFRLPDLRIWPGNPPHAVKLSCVFRDRSGKIRFLFFDLFNTVFLLIG